MSDQSVGNVRLATPAGKWIVLATVLGSGMASIDATVVGIALPTVGREFHAGIGALQWVVTGYTLSLAALLLLGGSLGDHYGRRRVFMIGVVWFALASVACAFAAGTTMLIITRVFQGVGAALLTPGSLAILQATFHPDDRGAAIGAWSGFGGIATAAGPLLGGYLIAVASWRWIFLINVPLGIVVLLLCARHVPESTDQTASRKIDVPGAVLATTALAGITYGLIEGPTQGWTSLPIVTVLVLGIGAAAAFLLVEHASEEPMLPLAVFRVRQFTATNLVTFIIYGALGGALFLLPVQLQIVDHYSPLESGISLLPLTIVMLLLSSRSGRLSARIGPRLQMGVGPVIVGLGLAMLTRTATDSFYPSGVLPAVLVFGLGLATTVAPLTSTALTSVPSEHSGLASAINNDVARLGALIAVAVLPVAAGISGTSYLHPSALSNGFNIAISICAGLCATGGIVAAIGIRNPSRAATATATTAAHEETERFHCALDALPMSAGPPPGNDQSR